MLNRKIKCLGALLLCCLFVVSICPLQSLADTINKTELQPKITEKFVADSTCYQAVDSHGETVIVLENTQRKNVTCSGKNEYAKTSAVLLPKDETAAKEILDNIDSITRGAATHTEDGWFFASSVYLTSTIYYTATTNNTMNFEAITKVTIDARVNNGTSISSMSLLLGQNGFGIDNVYHWTQSTTYNATTARTFTPPSSWVAVNVSADGASPIVAHLTCTAKRPSGETLTFTLHNIAP